MSATRNEMQRKQPQQLTVALCRYMQETNLPQPICSTDEDGVEYIELYGTNIHSVIEIMTEGIILCNYSRTNGDLVGEYPFQAGQDGFNRCIARLEDDYAPRPLK